MDLNKYTEKARESLAQSQRIASDYNHSQIEPEHLLLALLQQSDGVVPQIINKLNASPRELEHALQEELQRRPKVYGAATQVGISTALQHVLQSAETQAQSMHDEFVSTEHLLMGLILAPSGHAGELLQRNGIALNRVYEALTSIRGTQRVTDQNPEGKYQALEKYDAT